MKPHNLLFGLTFVGQGCLLVALVETDAGLQLGGLALVADVLAMQFINLPHIPL
jgi:hypothetical protein